MENFDGWLVLDVFDYLFKISGVSQAPDPISNEEYRRQYYEKQQKQSKELASRGIGQYLETATGYEWKYP